MRIYRKITDKVTSATDKEEFYLIGPGGKTCGILDVLQKQWSWFAHGAERIAMVTPESDQQPTNNPGSGATFPSYSSMSNTTLIARTSGILIGIAAVWDIAQYFYE